MSYDDWKTTEPDPYANDPDYCPVCRVHYTEPCEDGCDCVACQNAAERAYTSRSESGLTSGERSRLEQESVVAARRLK